MGVGPWATVQEPDLDAHSCAAWRNQHELSKSNTMGQQQLLPNSTGGPVGGHFHTLVGVLQREDRAGICVLGMSSPGRDAGEAAPAALL